MPNRILKLSRTITPGVFTVQTPGGIRILSIDSTGIVIMKPTSVSLPDEPHTFEVVAPGSDLSENDFGKYVYLGSVGDLQVFERVLD